MRRRDTVVVDVFDNRRSHLIFLSTVNSRMRCPGLWTTSGGFMLKPDSSHRPLSCQCPLKSRLSCVIYDMAVHCKTPVLILVTPFPLVRSWCDRCRLVSWYFIFSSLYVFTSAGRRRSLWPAVVWRRPGCFTRSGGVTSSSISTKKPETTACGQSLRPRKLLTRNGRLMPTCWWLSQNVIINPYVYKSSDCDMSAYSRGIYFSEPFRCKVVMSFYKRVLSFCFLSVKLGHVESSVSHFERALTQAALQDDDSARNVIQKVAFLSACASLPHLISYSLRCLCRWCSSFCFQALDEAKQQLPQWRRHQSRFILLQSANWEKDLQKNTLLKWK